MCTHVHVCMWAHRCVYMHMCTCTLEDRGQFQVPFPRSCLPCVLRQGLSLARSETSPRKARLAAGQQSSENRLSPPTPSGLALQLGSTTPGLFMCLLRLDSGPQMIFMSTSIRNHIHIGIYTYKLYTYMYIIYYI